MEIVELVKKCKLVKVGYEKNGNDCWGNYEYTSYKYVIVNGEIQKCWDHWYVIHDGANVKEVTPPLSLKLNKIYNRKNKINKILNKIYDRKK
mgnify:CR=1 FL=1